jgi:hypothetical protein
MKKNIVLLSVIPSILFAGPDPRGILELEGYGNNGAVGITAKKGRNDFTIKEPLGSGDSIFYIKGYGYDGVKFSTNPVTSVEFLANQAWTTTANGSKIVFKTTPDGTITPVAAMTIDDDGNVTITGAMSAGTMGSSLGVLVATQTIAAAGTIASDACGSIKRISSAGVVTSSTTTTFTAPTSANAMCVMDVCNVGANNITLDNNTAFKSIAGADIVLTPDDCTRVGQVGGYWTSLGSLVAN